MGYLEGQAATAAMSSCGCKVRQIKPLRLHSFEIATETSWLAHDGL